MSLPKINHPTTEITIPSNKNKIRMRPMLVKEEKILLTAKESQDETDIFPAVKQVVNNCIVEKNFNIDSLTLFDLEYLYLKLRAFSIDNVVQLKFQDRDDNKEYEFNVDLNKVEITFPENKPVIKIDDLFHIVMRYPSASIWSDKKLLAQDDVTDGMILNCIDKVFQNDKALTINKKEELEEFIKDLPIKVYSEMREFLLKLPKLQHVIEYKNSNDKERKIELNSLSDFFTLP